jgi:hypothetical protein
VEVRAALELSLKAIPIAGPGNPCKQGSVTSQSKRRGASLGQGALCHHRVEVKRCNAPSLAAKLRAWSGIYRSVLKCIIIKDRRDLSKDISQLASPHLSKSIC